MDFGQLLIAGTLIALLVLSIIAYGFQGGAVFPADPTSVAKWYSDILTGKNLPEENKALAIVFSVFVPFLATFSMLWALLLLFPVFQGYQTRKAASVLAFGMSLYTLPMMSFVFAAFLPWGMAVAGIMIVIGIIIISIRFISGPATGIATEIGEGATDVRRAWNEYREAGRETPAGQIEIDPAIVHGLESIRDRIRNI
jgi:hypothetical protein